MVDKTQAQALLASWAARLVEEGSLELKQHVGKAWPVFEAIIGLIGTDRIIDHLVIEVSRIINHITEDDWPVIVMADLIVIHDSLGGTEND